MKDEQLADFAARQYFIEYNGDITESALKFFIPSCIPGDKLTSSNSLNYWTDRITKAYKTLFGPETLAETKDSSDDVIATVVQMAKITWATCFSRTYNIEFSHRNHGDREAKGIKSARLSINSDGITLKETQAGNFVLQYEYHIIKLLTCYRYI